MPNKSENLQDVSYFQEGIDIFAEKAIRNTLTMVGAAAVVLAGANLIAKPIEDFLHDAKERAHEVTRSFFENVKQRNN